MADISKIKLPNGSTYDLKDSKAPRGGATLGVQEVLNPFAPGKDTELIKTDRLDNAFYFADKRWNVTATMVNITTGAETPITNLNLIASLFDMSEGPYFIINSNYRAVITIDFTGSDRTGVFKNFPYGYVYVNFYYTGGPKSMSARVYGKHTGNESYWLTLSPTADPRNTSTAIRYIISQNGMYNMQKLEISVDGSGDTSRPTRLSEISYYLTRADKNHDMPYVSKLREETLYYALTGPDFIGKINGHTVNKDVPSDAVFTDTTYSVATTSANGLMSSSDKTKLDRISSSYNSTTETLTIIL